MDPSGHIAVATIAKLGTGALFDMGMQLTANYFFNSKTKGEFKASFNAVNWWQVTVSAAQSLFTVKNAALTAAITGLGDVVVNWMKQGKKYSCGKALRDFAMGFLSDLATRYVCKFGKKAVAKGMEKMGVNSSGSDRPLKGRPNSYYSTANGEHVFVYDELGRLIYDISEKRVKAFKINLDPRGIEHYQAYKLKGAVVKEIKNKFGW